MNKHQLDHFRQKLLEEKRELQNLEANMVNRGFDEPMDIAATELSAYDQHPADYGSQMFEREQDIGLLENTRRQLREVEDALDLIASGEYGYCKRCHKQIDTDRLEALPTADLCVECKRQDEQEETYDVSARPVEEDVLNTPFSRSDKDNSDFTGFDGEDSWQKVAQFGTSNAPQDVPGSVEYGETYVDAQEDVGSVDRMDEIADTERDKRSGRKKYQDPE